MNYQQNKYKHLISSGDSTKFIRSFWNFVRSGNTMWCVDCCAVIDNLFVQSGNLATLWCVDCCAVIDNLFVRSGNSMWCVDCCAVIDNLFVRSGNTVWCVDCCAVFDLFVRSGNTIWCVDCCIDNLFVRSGNTKCVLTAVLLLTIFSCDLATLCGVLTAVLFWQPCQGTSRLQH